MPSFLSKPQENGSDRVELLPELKVRRGLISAFKQKKERW